MGKKMSVSVNFMVLGENPEWVSERKRKIFIRQTVNWMHIFISKFETAQWTSLRTQHVINSAVSANLVKMALTP